MKMTMRAYGIALALTCSLTASATLKAQSLYIGTDDIAIRSGSNVIPVPEPSTVALAVLGLGVAAFWLRRRAE